MTEKGNKVNVSFDNSQKEECLQFEAANKQSTDQQGWIDMLSNVANQSDAKKKHYSYLSSHIPEFYKFRHILNSEFEELANTGDILLFRSTHNAARAQQMLLNSEYGKPTLIHRPRRSCFEEPEKRTVRFREHLGKWSRNDAVEVHVEV